MLKKLDLNAVIRLSEASAQKLHHILEGVVKGSVLNKGRAGEGHSFTVVKYLCLIGCQCQQKRGDCEYFLRMWR